MWRDEVKWMGVLVSTTDPVSRRARSTPHRAVELVHIGNAACSCQGVVTPDSAAECPYTCTCQKTERELFILSGTYYADSLRSESGCRCGLVANFNYLMMAGPYMKGKGGR